MPTDGYLVFNLSGIRIKILDSKGLFAKPIEVFKDDPLAIRGGFGQSDP